MGFGGKGLISITDDDGLSVEVHAGLQQSNTAKTGGVTKQQMQSNSPRSTQASQTDAVWKMLYF